MAGALSGFKIIELAGIGPGPYAGQLLADMGAEVICIERPGPNSIPGADGPSINRRGKSSVIVDLRKSGAADIVLKLVESADALIEGNRPGVAERLGIGPEDCHKVNPKLVYGRMTGWGQTGPWANMAGHDINYISLTGALHVIGEADRPPPPPLNFVGDYGGGSLFLTNGILAALLKAQKTGIGDVVDAAILDGVNSLMAIVHSMDAAGLWSTQRGANMLTGSAPFYRCYECADGEYVAVGCIEPKFFKIMIDLMDIDPAVIGNHFNIPKWPEQINMLTREFLTKSRDEWAKIFDGTDACVTPVLNYKEAKSHKQIAARNGIVDIDGLVQPAIAPLIGYDPGTPTQAMSGKGDDTAAVLKAAGFSQAEIEALSEAQIIGGI